MKFPVQVSTIDFLAASMVTVVFATLNAVWYDVGFGSATQVYGWPFLAFANSPNGESEVHWAGAIGNALIGISTVVAFAMLLSNYRTKRIEQNTEIWDDMSDNSLPSVHPLDDDPELILEKTITPEKTAPE